MHLDGRCLPRAVLTEEPVELSRLDRKVDMIDRDRLTETANEPFGPNGRKRFNVGRGVVDQGLGHRGSIDR